MISVLIFILIGGLLGAALGYASVLFRVESNPLVDKIEALMPGGQCGQCGEAGCRQAAEAMTRGELAPDCCPPGGTALAVTVADLLGVSLDDTKENTQVVATIDESLCSGCTRCYKACPFDAIVGANKQVHTVITEVCTGCELCFKACPQECLTIKQAETELGHWYWPNPENQHQIKSVR